GGQKVVRNRRGCGNQFIPVSLKFGGSLVQSDCEQPLVGELTEYRIDNVFYFSFKGGLTFFPNELNLTGGRRREGLSEKNAGQMGRYNGSEANQKSHEI
ncbi:MAG: hypothetical protein ACO23R_18940, partial [bacterium]